MTDGKQYSAPLVIFGDVRLLAVAGTAFSLYIYRIDHQSVWADEAFTIWVCALPLPELLSNLVADFVHPPLHYLVVHSVFHAFGEGVLQARIPSALFATLAVVVIYSLTRRLFSPNAALIAAALLTTSQFHLQYAQEARPYALLVLLSLCATSCFATALQRPTQRNWTIFVIAVTAAAYTHYYAIFLLI